MMTIIDMAPVNVRSIELKGWLDQATLVALSKQRFPMISGFSMGNYKQGKVQGLQEGGTCLCFPFPFFFFPIVKT